MLCNFTPCIFSGQSVGCHHILFHCTAWIAIPWPTVSPCILFPCNEIRPYRLAGILHGKEVIYPLWYLPIEKLSHQERPGILEVRKQIVSQPRIIRTCMPGKNPKSFSSEYYEMSNANLDRLQPLKMSNCLLSRYFPPAMDKSLHS